MARVIIFFFFVIIATGASLAFRGCSHHTLEVDDTGRYTGLADGSVMLTPDGSITSVLVDWLRDPAATPRRFEVGGLQYAPGDTSPLPQARIRLGRLAQMLRAYPAVRVTLIGAVNPSGDAQGDQRLSEARARVCAGLLKDAGIAPERLAIAGEGSTRPRFAHGSARATHNDRIILVLARVVPAAPATDRPARRSRPL